MSCSMCIIYKNFPFTTLLPLKTKNYRLEANAIKKKFHRVKNVPAVKENVSFGRIKVFKIKKIMFSCAFIFFIKLV